MVKTKKEDNGQLTMNQMSFLFLFFSFGLVPDCLVFKGSYAVAACIVVTDKNWRLRWEWRIL